MAFPSGFQWGAATAAYQIEGAVREDGRRPSIWDVFCQRPGAIWNGDTGDVACDHYHRYAGDVELMQTLGLRAYRFSIAWPRVLPDGVGAVNAAGLDFYDRLVDRLVAANITPFVTLYHWDLPQTLQERGGWLNRESAAWFRDYAAAVVERLSDRVRYWTTINELQVVLHHGHLECCHAPGIKLERRDVLLAGHNLLRAHGAATQAIRSAARAPVEVGIAPVGVAGVAEPDTPENRAAARRFTLSVLPDTMFNNTWWLDPLFRGAYPEEGRAVFGADAPEPEPGDMELIHQPPDFVGLNIYFGHPVRAGADGRPEQVPPAPGAAYSPIGFLVAPEALYWGPKAIYERYRVPLYITENGIGLREWVQLDGRVHDPVRIDYLQRYIHELHRAIADGVDVRGYFVWSLFDNFEWGLGYRERFGLYYVDYATQRRIAKDSAYWYRDLIAANGAPAIELPRSPESVG